MRRGVTHWRIVRLLIAAGLLAAFAPMSVGADGHEATRTEASFTGSNAEVLAEGEEWIDEAGDAHLRGLVVQEEVSGDINGTAVITQNGDFSPDPNCELENVLECPGFLSFWASVEITGEDGRWNGNFLQFISTVEGEEDQFSNLVMRGTGGNAGKSFVGEIVEESEESITFAGQIHTMAVPVQGLNMSTNFCFTEDSVRGNAQSQGAIAGNGTTEIGFLVAGTRWTHRYALTGIMEYSDEHGSATFVIAAKVQDQYPTSNAWGHFVIVGGEGAYAELFGHGRWTGWNAAPGAAERCASGFGGYMNLYGEAHYN